MTMLASSIPLNIDWQQILLHVFNFIILATVLTFVLFTLLHALIQTYVLVVLTATYFGEVTEPHAVNPDKKKKKRRAAAQAA